MNVVVYDTGMLVALVSQDRGAHILHKAFVAAGGHHPIIPGPALSQAWPTSPKTAYAWKRLLADVVVYRCFDHQWISAIPAFLPEWSVTVSPERELRPDVLMTVSRF